MIKRRPVPEREGFAYPNLLESLFINLNDRQAQAVGKMVHNRGGLVWWRVGEGKTRIALYTFACLQNIYRWSLPSICLVICRRRAFYDWTEEIRRLWPDASVYPDQVPVYPPGGAPVFLLVSHAEVSKRLEALSDNKLIRFVVLDELWLYANHKSTRSKGVYKLTVGRKAVGLSGTVMKARDTTEVFCQAKAVQKHRWLASTLTKFKEEFQTTDPWALNKEWGKTITKPGAYPEIMRRLNTAVDVYFPKSTRLIHEQYHTIPATPQQLKHFRDLKDEYYLPEFDMEFDHAITTSIKAQQISNGWLKVDDDDYRRIPSNKPGKLEDELSDILKSGARAVVWCAFRYDVKMLAKLLPFASMQMLGGSDFDVDRWHNDSVRLCLATEASGSSVNYFQDTPYALYFSSNAKWLDMQQSRGRTDRKSSRHKSCFYKYLQVAGSLDSHIFNCAMASGRAERKLLTAGVKNWLAKL